MKKSLLIIFVKNLVPGKVKTRLAKTVGDSKALEVYEALLDKTKIEADAFNGDVIIYFSDYIPESSHWPLPPYFKATQEGEDLGQRMSHAFQEGFKSGYSSISIIGSDCFDLTIKHINEAFEKLFDQDIVIGPAKDGGYYLLGMKNYYPAIFTNKSWSSPALLNETKTTLDALGLSYHFLETLNDVDEYSDLQKIPELLRLI